MDISLRFKELREEKKMSQKDISSLLGISQMDVSRIENGKRKQYEPNLLIKMAQVFEVDLYWLITGMGRKQILNTKELEEAIANNEDEAIKDLITSNRTKEQQLEAIKKQMEKIIRQIGGGQIE